MKPTLCFIVAIIPALIAFKLYAIDARPVNGLFALFGLFWSMIWLRYFQRKGYHYAED